MKNVRIQGGVDNVGASQGFNGVNVKYGMLPTLIGDQEHVLPHTVTAWRPTKAELAALLGGACLFVTQLGEFMTPMSLQIGEPPPEGTSFDETEH